MLVDLSTTPISETLLRLSRERRSGDLQVRSAKIVKTIFLDHGRVVFAGSNMKKDRLGEALVALGRITSDEYTRATELMREGERRRRFGDALVRSGVMDKSELGRSVARQVKRIVISLFEFGDGAASFEERPCVIPLEYMVSLSLHRLLYVGIKSIKPRELVLAGLGDLDRWVTLAAVPPFRFGVKKCSAEELEILEQAKKRVTLRRLAWAPGGLSLSRMRVTYALLASGILEEEKAYDEAEAPQPVIQMETTTFLLSALRTRPDPTAREAIGLEVVQELERSAKMDRENWLRISRTAPRDELLRALEDKMERYHSLLEAAGDDAELKTDIEVILGRASSMLRLTKQASRPATPAGSAAAAPPAPRAKAPSAAVEKPAVEEPAPPEKSVARPAPEPPRPAPREKLSSPPPEPRGGEPPPAPVHHPPGEDHDAPSAMQVEHLLMEGDVRMTVSDYANAVKTFQRLVELVPDRAPFRVKLAIAMTFNPPTQKTAEREFLEAIRLDPQNADVHFQFGLYYKAMRVKSRAIAELQTSVRLNPRHKMARQELESLSPKDSVLTSLKKLLK